MITSGDNKPINIVRDKSEDEVKRFIDEIASVYDSLSQKSGCFIYGLGGQTVDFYRSLKSSYEDDLLWTGSSLPKVIGAILRFIPSHAGIIRIRTGADIISLFPLFTEQSMAGIFIFDLGLELKMVQLAQQRPKELQRFIEDDPTHFIYLVDEDSASDQDRVTEIIKCGIQCPLPLRNLLGER